MPRREPKVPEKELPSTNRQRQYDAWSAAGHDPHHLNATEWFAGADRTLDQKAAGPLRWFVVGPLLLVRSPANN